MLNDPPLHRRYPRLWTAYHELAHRLCIEPIPGQILDKQLLGSEFSRLYGLALDARIDVEDIITEATK
jgi:hypothetical protein